MANRGGVEMETMRHFIFLGSKITVDDDWSHEIKWRLFLGRKAITNVLWFSSVQFSCSVIQLFATPWITAHQASLFISNSRSPPKPMSIESVMPSNHLILCRSLLFLPSIFPNISIKMLSFKSQLFHSLLSPSSRGSLVPLHFLPLAWYHLHIWDCWYFSWQFWF